MTLSPLPVVEVAQQLPENAQVIVLEEVNAHCGICQDLALALQSVRPDSRVSGSDLGERYVRHGSLKELYDHYGLSPEAIAKYVMEVHHGDN